MIDVPIGEVRSTRFLNISGRDYSLQTRFPDPLTGEERGYQNMRMEVYTGWVLARFWGPRTVWRDEVRTFLPTSSVAQKPSNKIRSYAPGSLMFATATASPATIFLGDVDEDALLGVDGLTDVQLVPQQIPGIGPPVFCLILQVTLAAMEATILRFTYQVTVLMNAGDRLEMPKEITLEPETIPTDSVL